MPCWRFVQRVADPDTGLPPEERVAVFDDDGTLWCEMPTPVQLGAEKGLALAAEKGWTVVSVKDDWTTVF